MYPLRGFGLYVVIGGGILLLLFLLSSILKIESSDTLWDSTADYDAFDNQSRGSGGTPLSSRTRKSLPRGERFDRNTQSSQRIEKLERELERQRVEYRRLKSRYDTLAQQTGEDETLQSRADGRDASRSESENAAGEDDATADLRQRIQTLRGQLTTADMLIEFQDDELSRLDGSLKRLRDDNATAEEFQADLDQQAARLVRERSEIRSEASDALIRVGSPASGVLERLLTDRRAHVRSWAADLLNQIRRNGDTTPQNGTVEFADSNN